MTEKDSHFIFKLVSGEEVIAITTMDDSGVEPCFFLADPLKVELTHKGNHTMVRLVPWITVPEDEIFRIGFDKIITMTELDINHDMVQAYEHYNYSRKSNEVNKVKISEKMGYIGNTDKVKVSLEKIFTTPSDTIGITTTV
tara:strand:+ start:1422 stop:1844 length:423 start_codon:yes stop_codon:yes gene_type:complete